ncbi:alpha/beta hydrolase [Amycolatopsis nigrescens]|uniref:alpha/beta hydrolase n=1 Tax=Amycolatopsis nigrescens TaxID=381445 RepID=UPI00047793E9|nr:alpha/beta hydrolase family protein [Amycolatopsis nigrescens]
MRRWRMLTGVVLLFGVLLPAQATAADGARVVSETRVDSRTLDLVISSPALGAEAPVRLLLPERYDEEPGRKWPVLYLLHGCCEVQDYKSWTHYTDVEALTENKDVLVVMPSDGKAGMYSKWWNFGLPGGPDWETFHVTELRGILERDYQAGDRRAVAGLSIGGYGALAYAFRHPGMFRAAASYSGIPNTMQFGVPEVIQGILMQQGLNLMALWGNQYVKPDLWRSQNPYDNAEKFRGVGLYVSCGNGKAGPLDPPGKSDWLEPAALSASQSFTNLLSSKGIPVTTSYYGDGTHSWPYWNRALHESWPLLTSSLAL